jgi:predicted transposase YbfD/YdcC
MTDRELMQQALDALEYTADYDSSIILQKAAIEALRARLAQPELEWQGLTTAERKALWNVTKKPSEFAEMIEAKLKEKNEWICKN